MRAKKWPNESPARNTLAGLFLTKTLQALQNHEPRLNTELDRHFNYSTGAIAFAIPMLEALHLLASHPDDSNQTPRARRLASDASTPVECLTQFGTLCHTPHHLVEMATLNLDTDYHSHQAVNAASKLLRELACLAFQIEPCFSDADTWKPQQGPLMPERLPDIVPIAERTLDTEATRHARSYHAQGNKK